MINKRVCWSVCSFSVFIASDRIFAGYTTPMASSNGSGSLSQGWLVSGLPRIAGPLLPFALMLVALCFAVVYAFIPNDNVWVYILVKQELWSVFGIAMYAEMTQLCLPDIPASLYLGLYAVGTVLPLVVRSAAYLTNTGNDPSIQLFCTIIGLPFAVLFNGLYVYYHPRPASPGTDPGRQPAYWKCVEVTSPTPEEAVDGRYYDMFNCALSAVPDQGQPVSKGRRLWMDVQSIDSLRPSLAHQLVEIGAMNPLQLTDQSLCSLPANSTITGGTSSTTHIQPADITVGVHSKPWPSALLTVLPRYYYLSHGISLGIVTGSNLHQYAHLVLFFLCFNGYFYFLIYFVRIFKNDSDNNANTSTVRLAVHFALFIAGSSSIRFLLKREGMALDRNKVGSTSIFFIAEFAGLMFFYSFYRLIFESVDSWSVFIVLQVIHLAFEWLTYPLRASKLLYPYLMYLQEHPRLPWLRNAFVPFNTDFRDWLDFISLDFGVRIVVMTSTAVAIIILLTIVQFSSWIDSSLQEHHTRSYVRSMEFIMVAAVLELANAWLMNEMFFAKNHADVLRQTEHVFQDQRFAVMTVIIATNLLINPIYAFTKDNEYHYNG